MFLTVAICTRNRSRSLSQTLGSMKALVIPPNVEWELLIVNNNSTDATDDVIETFRPHLPIRRLFEPTSGKSHALNLAVHEARGEYILWTDDDCLVDPGWITTYCRAFKYWPDTAIFGGPILPEFEGTPPRWLQKLWKKVAVMYAILDWGPEPFPLSWVITPYGANFAVRTKEQRQYLYDPRLGPGPDRLIKGWEETTVVRKMLSDGIMGRWFPEAKMTHYIPKKRQTVGYLRSCYKGNGESLSLQIPELYPEKKIRGSMYPETPYLLWVKALFYELHYRVQCILSIPDVPVGPLEKTSTAWGKLFGLIKCKRAAKRNGAVPEALPEGSTVQRFHSNDTPVFIVGVPHSGTTLLASMLEAHSRLSCGPETHLFSSFSKIDGNAFYNSHSWPENAIEILNSSDKIVESFGLTNEEIRSYLADYPPSIAALLSSLTEQRMKKLGKKRWVEKSSLYLEHVYQIRRCFPGSPIIRIIRDPRNCALSQVETPGNTSTFFENLLDWKRLHGLSSRFFEDDPLTYTVRYEELLELPEPELKKICEFIGESFEPAMLNYSQLPPFLEPRTRRLNTPTEDQNRLAEALLGDELITYDYPCKENFQRAARVVPQVKVLKDCPKLVSLLVSQGVGFWRTKGDRSTGPLIYGGVPDTGEWRIGNGNGRTARLFYLLNVLYLIVQAKIGRQEIYWISGEIPNGNLTICSRILCAMLTPFKKTPK